MTKSVGSTIALIIGCVLGALILVIGGFVLLIVVALHNIHIGPITIEPSRHGMDVKISTDGAMAYVTEPTQGYLAVMNAHTGAGIALVRVGSGPTGLTISPNGTQVWVANSHASDLGVGSSVTVISTATNSVVGTIDGLGSPGAIDIAFTPDGATAYVTENGGVNDGGVQIIDTSALHVVGRLSPRSNATWNPTSVAVTPNGQQVWVSEGGLLQFGPGRVFVFDVATRSELARIRVGSGSDFMVLSASGRFAYVADKGSCDVQEIDGTRLQVIATVAAPPGAGCPYGIVPGATDGTVYAVTGSSSPYDAGSPRGDAFETYGMATGAVGAHSIAGSNPLTLALSPDGRKAYVVDGAHPSIDVVDTATGVLVSRFVLPLPPKAGAEGSQSGGGG